MNEIVKKITNIEGVIKCEIVRDEYGCTTIDAVLDDKISFVTSNSAFGFGYANGTYKSSWSQNEHKKVLKTISDIINEFGFEFELDSVKGMWHTEITISVKYEKPNETSGGAYISTSGNEITFDWEYRCEKYHTSKVSYGNGEMWSENVDMSETTLAKLENAVVNEFKYKS